MKSRVVPEGRVNVFARCHGGCGRGRGGGGGAESEGVGEGYVGVCCGQTVMSAQQWAPAHSPGPRMTFLPSTVLCFLGPVFHATPVLTPAFVSPSEGRRVSSNGRGATHQNTRRHPAAPSAALQVWGRVATSARPSTPRAARFENHVMCADFGVRTLIRMTHQRVTVPSLLT